MWFTLLFLGSNAMDSANREGQAFAQQHHTKIMSDSNWGNVPGFTKRDTDAVPAEEVPEDVQVVMKKRREKKYDLRDDDPVIIKSEAPVQDPEGPLAVRSHCHQPNDKIIECREAVSVPHSVFHRTLHLNISHTPRSTYTTSRQVKRCTSDQGHRDDDPQCVEWRWATVTDEHVTPERTDYLGESWQVDTPDLLGRVQRNECNIINSECVDGPGSRTYYNQSYYRDCWRQRVTVICPGDKVNTCAPLRKRGCVEVRQDCLKYAPDGRCESYVKWYRCAVEATHTVTGGLKGIYCLDGGPLTPPKKEFDDMGTALAQLSVLDEMENELKDMLDLTSAKNVRVFKGECKNCTKNVLENLLYDCCSTMDGFAISLSLTNCNAEERNLAKLREEGRCHYVGSIPRQFLGALWKSSDRHIYCCFMSKLVAHLQKEARRLLGYDWGTPEKPNCDGLSMEDIQRLDFSQMDLSPIFDDIMQNAKNKKNVDTAGAKERMQKKIQSLHGKFKS